MKLPLHAVVGLVVQHACLPRHATWFCQFYAGWQPCAGAVQYPTMQRSFRPTKELMYPLPTLQDNPSQRHDEYAELRLQLAEAQGMIKGLEQNRRQEHDSLRLAVEAVRGSQQEPQLTATLASLLVKVSFERTARGMASQAMLHCSVVSLLVRRSGFASAQVMSSFRLHISRHMQHQLACSTFQCHGQCPSHEARQPTESYPPCGRSQLQRRRHGQPGWQLRTSRPR